MTAELLLSHRPPGGGAGVPTTAAIGSPNRRRLRPRPTNDATPPTADELAWFGELFRRMLANVDRRLHGKRDHIAFALIALIAEGHLLIEDVPGVGKTTLARSIADTIAGTWNRIQATPDLSSGDITGRNVFHGADGGAHFHPGPVFANVVIGDELNRASPRALAALLEAMEERRVTVDGITHHLPWPCFVVATQNPADIDDGAHPLPPAQRDRFLVALSLGYPDDATEARIATARRTTEPAAVAGLDDVARMIAIAAAVECGKAAVEHAVTLVRATREHPDVAIGASPRATNGLVRAARSMAAAAGRGQVVIEDVERLAAAVLTHRLVLTSAALRRGIAAADVIGDVLDRFGRAGDSLGDHDRRDGRRSGLDDIGSFDDTTHRRE